MEKGLRLDLCGEWILTDDRGNRFTANVPGCVHTELAGEELYWRDQSKKYQWIEEHDWIYQKEFDLDEIPQAPWLVFEGLDTYCDIFLNGEKLGHAENMFLPHRFFTGDFLKKGKNELKVIFYSPVKMVENREKREGAFSTERLYSRRMQCTYGWDWVERFVTCGIDRPVYLTSDTDFGVEELYIYTESVDSYGAAVAIRGSYKNHEKGSLVKLEILSPEGGSVYENERYVNNKEFAESITIPQPCLWYPSGYGEQPLYTLRLTYDGGVYSTKFGIRTVRIMELPDEKGSRFYDRCLEIKQTESAKVYDHNEEFSGFILLVNGQKIMCMGANYVPSEPFISKTDKKKLTSLLETAKNGGINMIRVWGGGFFEQEHFYAECDRLGFMVVQDFLMACGNYPEDEEWFIEQLKQETEYAARLLRNHPCLMWWHGDNENAVDGSDQDADYPGKRSAYQGMLPVLNRLDYTRRLLPSSPYGGRKYASKTVGTTHNTQYLSFIFSDMKEKEMEDYKEYFGEYTARFISEEPIFGAVSKNTMQKMMTEEDFYDASMKMWYHHTKTNPPLGELMDLFLDFGQKILGTYVDRDDLLFKFQYLQYEQVRIAMERSRKDGWFCAGILFWMLNDCWPAASGWAMIDYYLYPKAAYYSFQRAAKHVISITEADRVIISNIGNKAAELLVKCDKCNIKTGKKEELFCENIRSEAGALSELLVQTDLKENEILWSSLYDRTGKLYDRSFYKQGKLLLEPADKVQIKRLTDRSFQITAEEDIHAIELASEGIFEENWFSMETGEKKVVRADRAVGELTVNAYRLK